MATLNKAIYPQPAGRLGASSTVGRYVLVYLPYRFSSVTFRWHA